MRRRSAKFRWVVSALFGITVFIAMPTCHAMKIVDDSSSGVLTIMDGNIPVLSYQYADKLPEGIDKKYNRSTYIHPLWSVDGKTAITEDFPADHRHHHGIFWAWPRVWTRGVQTQTWHPDETPLRQQFDRWISRAADDHMASFTVENKWLLDNKEEVARERVSVRARLSNAGVRLIEFIVELEAVGGSLKLGGSTENNKGYGGFSFRGAPQFKGAQILTSSGPAEKDVVGKKYKWVDQFNGKHGIAIFASPDHPDYPPQWMARNSYAGYVNVSWPGLEPVELKTGESVTLRYGVLVHDRSMGAEELRKAYGKYAH